MPTAPPVPPTDPAALADRPAVPDIEVTVAAHGDGLATPPAPAPAPIPATPTPLAVAIETAAPARRRFRVLRAYAAALRVAASYLVFEIASRIRGRRWAARRRPALHARNGRRVRRSILKLRGLFIKAGQLGSALTNLLPEPFRIELEGLQDRVPAGPPAAARARIESELGGPVATLFTRFDTLPVASASLAQVHRARLADGREVAVKVQHADIEAIARLDLHAIETILRAVGRFFGIRGLREQFREIEAVILSELDFAQEAQNMVEIAPALGPGVSAPAVVPERSSRRVLTTDYVDGIKAGDFAALDAAGIDRMALAARILDAYGAMIFRDGLYHADPHAGNLLVVPDATQPDGFELVFLDFGAVARLTPPMQTGLAEMIVGVLSRDTPRVMAALGTMGFVSDGDTTQATAAVIQFMESAHEELFHNLDPRAFRLGDLSFETALSQKQDMFRQMGDVGLSVRDLASAFRVPRDWILLERTALLLIGLCGGLAPDINPLTVIEPYIRPLTKDATRAVGTALWGEVLSAGRVLLGLPTRIDRVLADTESGGLAVSDPAVVAATDRLARSVRGLAYAVGAVGSGGIAYAAFAGGHGGIALALAVVAGLFGIGTLRAGRR
ncbi:ABC1 kinase family protein [Rubrivirga sp. IMCC43871]|uniref:ABC1 kinase family protein n=1 Tax=Rubrivirga sp. IMCC43871 TaxID=3391575 RepID=UPI00398FA0CB